MSRTTETETPALLGERVEITVRGSGRLRLGSAGIDYDWTGGAALGWTALTDADDDVAPFGDDPAVGQPAAGTIAAGGWQPVDYLSEASDDLRHIYIHIDLATPVTIRAGESVVATFDYTQGNHTGAALAWRIVSKDSGGTWTGRASVTGSGTTDGTDQTISWTPGSDIVVYGLAVGIRSDNFTPRTGSALLKSLVLTGGAAIFGDAHYYWTDADPKAIAFGLGFGLQVEGRDFTSIPPYSETHEYRHFETVTSGPVDFNYNPGYASSEGEPFSIQILVCFRGVP